MQSIWLDADESNGISEELSKALDVSLNHIDTYRYCGGIILLLGKTTDSGGGGVTEILFSELKNVDCISFLYHIINSFLISQSKALQKSV